MTAPATLRPATATRHRKLQGALIDAAERTIAEQGLVAVRARSLAEAAGCSVGAIYTMFSDIDGIILAVNGRTLAAIDQALAQAAAPDAMDHLVRLAAAYLDYAAANRPRWAALFLHTMGEGRSAPEWYARQQDAAFSHVEAPLAQLCPAMPQADRAMLARSLFAAAHGVVALGLDEKVAAMSLPTLHGQVATVVRAIANGLIR